MRTPHQAVREAQRNRADRSLNWPGWFTHRTSLLAIIVLAVLLRVASSLFQGDSVTILPGIYDQVSYDGLARRVLEGYGFSFGEPHWPATPGNEPTAHWSYLYTLYLTAIYAIFGPHPLMARLIQSLLAGVFHCWLAYRVGQRVFGPVVGLVAAGLSAVYLYFVYYSGALITETFYILGILWTFDLTLQLAGYSNADEQALAPKSAPWHLWVKLGLALAITVLLRQLFLLFIPFLFGWLWWMRSRLAVRQPSNQAATKSTVVAPGVPTWQGFLLATLVLIGLIAPWTLRNYQAFGVFVLLNTNAGFAFFWGNHPIHGANFISILPETLSSYYDLIPKELLSLNEAQLDRALLAEGIGFVRADPLRYLSLSFSRIYDYFKFWPSPDSSLISNISRVGSFGLCLPLIFYGLYLSLRNCLAYKNERQRLALMLFYMFILVYTGIHLLTWTLIRYRLPIDAIFLMFAAYALVELWRRATLRDRSPHRLIAPNPQIIAPPEGDA